MSLPASLNNAGKVYGQECSFVRCEASMHAPISRRQLGVLYVY
jgi:hypothetical protein